MLLTDSLIVCGLSVLGESLHLRSLVVAFNLFFPVCLSSRLSADRTARCHRSTSLSFISELPNVIQSGTDLLFVTNVWTDGTYVSKETVKETALDVINFI